MALTGIFYAGLVDKGVRIDNRPEAFASADSDAPEILNTIREQFGRDDLFVVLIDGDIRSESDVKNLQELESAIKGITFESEAAPLSQRLPRGASVDADDDWGGDDWGDESSADAGIALNPLTRPSIALGA